MKEKILFRVVRRKRGFWHVSTPAIGWRSHLRIFNESFSTNIQEVNRKFDSRKAHFFIFMTITATR